MNKFDEYVSNYDMNIPEINYKYYHSFRVMDNMAVIAKSMNLTMCDVKLAKCIGLLHDIGRFEQYKQFQSFDDINIDHGDYGEEVLRKGNFLKDFDISKEDYEVVYKAIRNHNKYKIEEGLTKRELLFAKMIRDADKLDIVFAIGNADIKSVIREDDTKVRDRVKKQFFDNKQVIINGKETKNEELVVMFSFIYDFNYGVSLIILKNKEYYQKIYQRLKHKRMFKPYIEHIINYLNERTD